MNKTAIIYWGSLFVWGILISLFWIKVAKDSHSTISTPVEEIYHRQLVTTIDSILNARFGPGCCEEVIDSDDVSIPNRLFSSQKFVDMVE